MQNKSGDLFRAQQGARDIDTGNPVELETEFHDTTGKEFTPQQRETAGKLSGKVRETAGKLNKANGELQQEIVKQAAKKLPAEGMDVATKKALDAANKVVREHAARLARLGCG